MTAGRRHLSEADVRARPRCWRPYELREHEAITGIVLRMPVRGAYCGSKIFIHTGTEIVALAASEKAGHAVLERELARRLVKVGDRITVENKGFQRTLDGRRSYRLEQVVV